MNAGLEQLEDELQHGLDAVAPRLDTPPPRDAWVAAVKDAVDYEARRWRRTHRLYGLARPAAAVAAAVLLVVGVGLPLRATAPADLLAAGPADPDAAVAQWLGALEDSGDQLTALVDQDTLLDAPGNGGDATGHDADPLRLIEESLDHFESMMGA